jgi:hypothetical protein
MATPRAEASTGFSAQGKQRLAEIIMENTDIVPANATTQPCPQCFQHRFLDGETFRQKSGRISVTCKIRQLCRR